MSTMHHYRGLNRKRNLQNKWPKMPCLNEVPPLDPEFDTGGEPKPKPAIEADEYAFIEQSLQRWRDRDYRHTDPWRNEPSMVQVWT